MDDTKALLQKKTELLRRLEAKKAKEHIFSFAKYIAPSEYQFNWHHDLLYQYLQAFVDKKIRRLIIEMPPGHGKSEGVSRVLPAYLLGVNPHNRVMTATHTIGLSEDMSRDVQRIMLSEQYQLTFPETKLAQLAKGEDDSRSRQTAGYFDIVGARGSYRGHGVGSAISGRRFEYGIIDDPIAGREAANSTTIREKIWRWYNSEFWTRQAKNASILITMTRWHKDDLVGRLLEKSKESKEAEQWEVLSLPAIAERHPRHPADKRQAGEVLWPWLRSIEEIMSIREADPREFASLFQQDPSPEGGAEWPDYYFAPSIYFDEWPTEWVAKVITVDPSKGKGEGGDYACIIMAMLDTHGKVWVDAKMSNIWDVNRIVDEVVDAYVVFKPDAIAGESVLFQSLFLELFKMEADRRCLDELPLHGVDPKGQHKEVRIRTLGPYLHRGEFRFKRDSKGVNILINQMRDFPNGQHDDGPDALAYAIQMLWYLLAGNSQQLTGMKGKVYIA